MSEEKTEDGLNLIEEGAGKEEPFVKNHDWNILIVDDEEEMHNVTKLVLSSFVFMNRKIKFYNAFSVDEAKKILESCDDIALILLDVVMKEDDSGLKLVHYIRNELQNNLVRIILRTGQPGHAPESKVIIDYDINDYKEKTELSAQKLITAVVSSLRAYHHIMQIHHFNNILEGKVAKRTRELEVTNEKLRKTLVKLEEDEKAGKLIQSKFLPTNDNEIKDYFFSYFYQPSLYLSGDFIEYFTINDEFIGFYALDVSGHGVSSALVTAMIKFSCDKMLADYQQYKDETILSPSKFVSVLNTSVVAEELDKYFTIFYGVINTKVNTLCYTNAGQYPYPLLIQNGKDTFLKQKNNPVGLFDFAQYKEESMELADDFVLYIPSDGGLDVLKDEKLDDKTEKIYSVLKSLSCDTKKYASKLKITDQSDLPDDVTLLMIRKGQIGG